MTATAWNSFVQAILALARICGAQPYRVAFYRVESFCGEKRLPGRDDADHVTTAAQRVTHLPTNCQHRKPEHASRIRGAPFMHFGATRRSSGLMSGHHSNPVRSAERSQLHKLGPFSSAYESHLRDFTRIWLGVFLGDAKDDDRLDPAVGPASGAREVVSVIVRVGVTPDPDDVLP